MRSSVQNGTETQYVGLHQCYLPSMHQVVCIFAAPIPVGHRVECQWFAEQVQGVLSGARTVTWNHEPLIKDLDTGIEYSSHRAWQVMGGKASTSATCRTRACKRRIGWWGSCGAAV